MLYNIITVICLGGFFTVWTIMALAWCGATIEEIKNRKDL